MTKQATRKPGRPKLEITRVRVAARVKPDVAAFLSSTGNTSRSIEDAIRRTAAYRQWAAEHGR